MSDAMTWRVTLHLRNYAQARTLFQLGILIPHESVTFAALDKDGNPLWTDEDEARLTAELAATE